MSAAPPSLLTGSSERLGPFLGLALVGHVVGAAVLITLQIWGSHAAPRLMVDPSTVLTVELLSVSPKGAVSRAQRAPKAAAAPLSTAEAPPPVRTSDLTIPSDVPDPGAKVPTEDKQRLDALMKELQLERLMDDLGAPEGAVDRDAASPDGVEGVTNSMSGSNTGDPEYARYIASVSKLFVAQFRPLPALLGQGLVTVVLVEVDTQGRVQSSNVSKESGNPSWDRAALQAATDVPAIPLPPERFRDSKPDRYLIRFEDPR